MISTPLQPIPETISLVGVLVIILMLVCTRHRASVVGLLIFVTGGLLAAIASADSSTLGFRYLWIPVFGQVLWLVGTLPRKRLTLLLLPLIVLGTRTFQERVHWLDNTAFWENGYTHHPNQHTACGAFMTLRDQPTLALARLQTSIAPPPKLHCCAQASRYPLELGDMALTVSMGSAALTNGCPKIPELMAPIAMAHAVLGNWTESQHVLDQYSTDPFGYKPLLETANGLRNDDEGPLKRWAAPENTMLPNTTTIEREEHLREQAETLLKKIHMHAQSE